MNPFLSNYINSISARRQQRVGDVLQEATLSKSQLDIIAGKLSTASVFTPLSLRQVNSDEIITSSDLQLNLRDTFNRIQEMYIMSNLISLLLDSHQKMLGADIKALEDQLVAMEKLTQNYAFLMSDAGAYNYAYIESFNDERGRDSFNWPIPDRAGQIFSASEIASVRPDEACVVIPSELNISYSLIPQLLKGNALAFVTSDTGIINSVDATSSTGWRAAYASSSPITSFIPESPGIGGAQVMLEFRLDKASPASEIKLVPFSDLPLQLIRVTTYSSDDDSTAVNQLALPLTFDRTVSIHFPMSSVSRFRVLLNQPNYTRTLLNYNQPEEQYRVGPNVVGMTTGRTRIAWSGPPGPLGALKDVPRGISWKNGFSPRPNGIDWIQNVSSSGLYSTPAVTAAAEDFLPEVTTMAINSSALNATTNLQYKLNTHLGDNSWNNFSSSDRTVLNIFAKGVNYYSKLFSRDVIVNTGMDSLNSMIPSSTDPPAISTVPVPSVNIGGSTLSYQYNLGLKFVGIGTDIVSLKGQFVSKIIPSDGDMGQVKLKVSDENYVLPTTDRDSATLTSVEYSVSNVSNPQREGDWFPILPVNTTLVEAERLYPDQAGTCNLRFLADQGRPINLYKNGYNFSNFTNLTDPAGNFITGFRVPVNTYSGDDILTVRYFPLLGQDVLDFSALGFSDAPLVTAFDNTGAGEGFDSTSGRNSVDLSFLPYVDVNQVSSSLYKPVTIILHDGTIATNLTNYIGTEQPSLPIGGDYYFIHSGNIIMFNQPVTNTFRVYYQYLQNNVRVRVVLRANSSSFVTPKVHYFQLKATTRQPNAMRTTL